MPSHDDTSLFCLASVTHGLGKASKPCGWVQSILQFAGGNLVQSTLTIEVLHAEPLSFGEKDSASKIYVAGMQEAIKKSRTFCPVEDLRAATYALDVAGVDTGEEHDRAALSVVLVSEKGTMMSHWVRLSSIDNVEKNSADDLTKIERAVQKAKRQH